MQYKSIDAWREYDWYENEIDPREDRNPGEEWEDWMRRVGFSLVQSYGKEDGLGAALWRSSKTKSLWIVNIRIGPDPTDVVVSQMTCLMNLLAHIAPAMSMSSFDAGATSIVLEMFAEASEVKAQMKAQMKASYPQGATRGAAICNCGECQRRRASVN